jgi:hypothetical protein
MSKPDPNQVEFHAHIAIDREELQMSKDLKLIQHKQERMAEEFGRLIARTKGWKTSPEGPYHTSTLDLYIFTRNELYDYTEAAFKERLLKMADTELLDTKTRETLRVLAERF